MLVDIDVFFIHHFVSAAVNWKHLPDLCFVSLLQGTDFVLGQTGRINTTTTAPLLLRLLLCSLITKWWKPSTLTGFSIPLRRVLRDGISSVFLFIAAVVERTFLRSIFYPMRNICQIFFHQAGGKWWLQHFPWMVCTAWMCERIFSNHKTLSASELPMCLCLWVNVILVKVCGCVCICMA